MKRYPKAIRKKFQELANLVWQRELDEQIALLAKRFDEWREKKIDCFQLNDFIHKFHNGPSQEIWKKHNYFDADTIVAMAVASGILKKEGIPQDIFQYIDESIESYKKSYPKCIK